MLKRLQKIQNAAAGYVLRKYSNLEDVLNLKWLHVKERIEMKYTKITHKLLYNEHGNYPSYLSLQWKKPRRTLRSNATDISKLETTKLSNTFNSRASTIFNKLPKSLRKNDNYVNFSESLKSHLLEKAISNNLSL